MSNRQNDYTGKLQYKPEEGQKFGASFGQVGININRKKEGNQPDFYGWIGVFKAEEVKQLTETLQKDGKAFITFSAWKNKPKK